ncbi:MAG: PAS domain S-box protein, partial [Candidatus Binataceae bacterium]
MRQETPERGQGAAALRASGKNSAENHSISREQPRQAIEANELAPSGTPSTEHATRAPYSTVGNELTSRTWASRYIRVAAMLLVFFLAVYLAVDLPLIDSWRSATLWLHLAAIASGTVFFSLIGAAWFDRNWHWLTIALCVVVFAATAEVGLINSTSEPIFIMVMLVVLGAAALMPWNAGWQALLTLCGLLAVLADSLWASPAGMDMICRWTALFAMAGVAHFSSLLGERYRVELSARMNALGASHERLLAEMAKRKLFDREREGARKRMAESETKLREIFDASLDAVAITRVADGVYIDVNRAFEEITGYRKAEVVGATVAALNVWVNIDERRKFARQLRQSGARHDKEVMLRDRDGTERPFLLSANIVELDGEPCVVSITRDITRRKKIEAEQIAAREAALAASEAKSEFLSSTSHEIRTPMNAVLGMADLLWESPLSFQQRRYLNTMRTNGNALLGLINGILDLAKVESGRLNLESTPFDLDCVVDRVLETLGIRAHEKGIELAGRIMADVPLNLLGDPLRLRQILINLVGNAIKFTERGEVVVGVSAKDFTAEDAESAEEEREKQMRKEADTLSSSESPTSFSSSSSVASASSAVKSSCWLHFSVRDTGIGIPEGKQVMI